MKVTIHRTVHRYVYDKQKPSLMFTINQPNGLHPSLVHANNGRAGCRGFTSGIENLKLRTPLDFVFFSMSFSVRRVIYALNNMSKKCHFKTYLF